MLSASDERPAPHIQHTLSPASPSDAAPDIPSTLPLSTREREVLQHLALGERTARIADTLCISTATVRNHIQHIFEKLGTHSRLEALAIAFHRGIPAEYSGRSRAPIPPRTLPRVDVHDKRLSFVSRLSGARLTHFATTPLWISPQMPHVHCMAWINLCGSVGVKSLSRNDCPAPRPRFSGFWNDMYSTALYIGKQVVRHRMA